jgi:RNA polymerase sigma-70 factor (ECF subfamily)
MFRILHNHWIDHLRRMKAEGMTEDVTMQTQLIGDPGEGPVISRLVLTEVQRAIDNLPPEQREVLVLVCGEDLTYREAAEILNIPVGTVMSRLARARKRLVELTAAA